MLEKVLSAARDVKKTLIKGYGRRAFSHVCRISVSHFSITVKEDSQKKIYNL